MKHKANEYNISIRFNYNDGLFEARILELPDVTEFGGSCKDVYELAIDTIETTADMFESKGRTDFPVPEHLKPKQHHCTVNSLNKEYHDDCVWDTNHPEDCQHASDGLTKEDCPFWEVKDVV